MSIQTDGRHNTLDDTATWTAGRLHVEVVDRHGVHIPCSEHDLQDNIVGSIGGLAQW